MAVEQSVNRNLRSIERNIGRIGLAAGAIAAAGALSAIPYAIPSYSYW